MCARARGGERSVGIQWHPTRPHDGACGTPTNTIASEWTQGHEGYHDHLSTVPWLHGG